jgi:UDP-N-acetylglucosamine:LPS N-acetylglucosamine transferase
MNNRVVLVASSGGHWVQLCRIVPAFRGKDVYFASTVMQEIGNFYLIEDINRKNLFKLPLIILKCISILIKIKPEWVVTTGAMPGLVMIFCGKILGKKTIWIDSVANCDAISDSGRLARFFSDYWLTQWPHLSGDGKSKPIYLGSVI